jgi:predicted metalloprotease
VRAGRAERRRVGLPRLGLAAAVLGLAAVAGLGAFGPWSAPGPAPLSGDRAELAARRAEAAFADAERHWARRFRDELGRDYPPAELRFFSRAKPRPCGGDGVATGPFHCAESGTAFVDLAMLDALGARLRRDAERGAALFVGRVAAGHAQAALGEPADASARARAERGDCLAGVWARHASAALGEPTPDLYGRMLAAAAAAVGAAAAPGARRDPVLFAPGAQGPRQAAFGRGLAGGAIAACAAG